MIRPQVINIIKIGTNLTGIEIKNDHRELTRFIISYSSLDKKVNMYINLNLKQIDEIWDNDLKWRRYNYQYRYLQSLLHEVAHCKQFKKINSLHDWTWGSNICYVNEHREEVADRYARRYYKKFIRG